jgi:hypothetical protein
LAFVVGVDTLLVGTLFACHRIALHDDPASAKAYRRVSTLTLEQWEREHPPTPTVNLFAPLGVGVLILCFISLCLVGIILGIAYRLPEWCATLLSGTVTWVALIPLHKWIDPAPKGYNPMRDPRSQWYQPPRRKKLTPGRWAFTIDLKVSS